MNELKIRYSRLILMLLFLIVIGLVVQGVMISKLYNDENSSSPLDQVAERVETIEDNLITKKKDSVKQELSKNNESSQRSNRFGDLSMKHRDWHPFQEVRQMRDQIDKMFGHSMERFQDIPGFDQSWLEQPFTPEADFIDKVDYYLFRIDLPGIEKSKIKISIVDHLLTVSGQKNEVIEEKDGDKILRTERRYGQFQRTFSLPGGIEGDGVKAEYKEGVITITIPKGEGMNVTKDIKLQ